MNAQLGMFDLGDTPAPRPADTTPAVKSRRGKTRPMRPDLAGEVLDSVHHGRLGLLDDSDRVVVFEDDRHVRLSADEDIVHALLAQRYVERCPARETTTCLHGVVRKPVSPLRLTRSGLTLRTRWASLHPLT